MENTSASKTKVLASKEIFPGVFNETGDYLKDVIAFAQKVGLLESLDKQLLKLKRKAENGLVIYLYKDGAPYSFYFRQTYNGEFSGEGGILYHGPADNFGSGQGPTFAVCLTPVHGWATHT